MKTVISNQVTIKSKIQKENKTMLKVKDLIVGERYHLDGNIQNGDYITHESVTRKITRITDKLIYCECGRRFIIDKELSITEWKRPQWWVGD